MSTPEDGIIIEFNSSQDSGINDTLCQSCSRTFKIIFGLLKYKEFSLPLAFLLVQGILLPNFDDLHYVFLVETVGMPKYEYDFLNSITYVATLLFIILYNQFFTRVQIWIMILFSLLLILIMTLLMLANATRMNTESWGMSDEVINAFIFFLGTNAVQVLAASPITVLLTYLVPHNVEASVMALVSGAIVWSYEVGAKISASIYCQIFDVDDDHMDNYPRVLTAKIPMIILIMIVTPFIIPRNQKILQLAARLRKKHQEKQSLKR